VASMGPLATIDGKFRQAWKGATVAIDSCAGVWLVGVHHQFLLCSFPIFILLFALYPAIRSLFCCLLLLFKCTFLIFSLIRPFLPVKRLYHAPF